MRRRARPAVARKLFCGALGTLSRSAELWYGVAF
jgi:hypothetical protein